MRQITLLVTLQAGILLALFSSALAALAPAEHPFILWTRDEAAAIRKRVETEPWAQLQYEAMLKEKGNGQTFRNLFRLLVIGDESVVAAEKQYLVSLIGNDPRTFKGDTGGGRHYDQYLSALVNRRLGKCLSGKRKGISLVNRRLWSTVAWASASPASGREFR